jgi:hypothetical protein
MRGDGEVRLLVLRFKSVERRQRPLPDYGRRGNVYRRTYPAPLPHQLQLIFERGNALFAGRWGRSARLVARGRRRQCAEELPDKNGDARGKSRRCKQPRDAAGTRARRLLLKSPFSDCHDRTFL